MLPTKRFTSSSACFSDVVIHVTSPELRKKAQPVRIGETHELCQSQLLKLIKGLSDVSQESKRGGQAFLRRLPVKFSSTIHGGAKKKKRPTWALFF
ncbi:hypothetical protein [Paraburkholderia sp. BL23I1N1]|uniref:hypothetical protein n=1 Tax=Paraburkholderia sp. BL23I1N1 TaxID=1938802 RepID=UPI0015FF10B2|nr:hypothetical protein [Paraburkholderia sp. BL23I1N1]